VNRNSRLCFGFVKIEDFPHPACGLLAVSRF
jgi:hypothetical protein